MQMLNYVTDKKFSQELRGVFSLKVSRHIASGWLFRSYKICIFLLGAVAENLLILQIVEDFIAIVL